MIEVLRCTYVAEVDFFLVVVLCSRSLMYTFGPHTGAIPTASADTLYTKNINYRSVYTRDVYVAHQPITDSDASTKFFFNQTEIPELRRSS